MESLDSAVITSLISPFVEQATCLCCCKLYIAPETAKCGHTSCHTCWRKRKSCVSCAAPLDRRSLKLNVPIQIITEHVHNMCDLFEEVFEYRVEEFSIGDGFNQLNSEPDPTNEVKNWLASSQNHFSAPISSESQDYTGVEKVTSTVQVHSHTKTISSPQKVVLKQTAQDDWEKIEQLPDTDEIAVKNPKVDVNNEYSTEYPRRSSRKRELKHDECVTKNIDVSKDKSSSKNSSIETESKTIKTKQKWNNVKKMRREFSKLNKQNRSKLNVSIEMCKKSKLNSAKSNSVDQITTADQMSDQVADIEDDTPCNNTKKLSQKKQKENPQDTINNSINANENSKTSQNDINVEIAKSGPVNKNINNNIENDKMCVNLDFVTTNDKEKASKMPFYKKGTLHIDTNREVGNDVQTVNYNIDCSNSHNTEDIEITIKIGDTVANIFFKRKKNEPPKITVNQEIQTSIGVNTVEHVSQPCDKNIDSNESITRSKNGENVATVGHNQPSSSSNKLVEPDKLIKSVSKKNTASAETVTAQLEITASIEKELSNVMELEENEASNKQNSKIISNKSQKITQVNKNKLISNTQPKNDQNEIPASSQILTDYLNEQDIFDSGSVMEQNVHILKNAKNTPSEILPTMKSIGSKTLKKAEKRDRDASEDIETTNKKQKVIQDSPKQNDLVDEEDKSSHKEFPQDSEGINYDAIMGQVFANIDADIHNTQKSKAVIMDTEPVEEPSKTVLNQQKTVILVPEQPAEKIINIEDSCIEDIVVAQDGYSENVFTVVEKENNSNEIIGDQDQMSKAVEEKKDNFLTPEVFVEDEEKLCTPHLNNEDDDKSVVEDTPQKNVSFTKPKNKSENAQPNLSLNKQKSMNESQVKSVVDVSDSEISSKISKDVTVVDLARKHTETPLTINRFVDEIKHKSTPVARKSLNFDDEDPEQTLCPTTEPAKTTQEKEFMARAFENTPKSPLRKPLVAKNKFEVKPYCLAGSCLTSSELMKVKILCRQNNWKYMDKYSDELTHLVVGVDDENKSQRSVKYMCALAASKWIVSFRWIETCFSTNKIVKEDQFEALDGTGEPGPRRSRLAHKKLFEGITFYCMPPFSVLDLDTLKGMLVSSGGTVAEEVRGVRAEGRPALLLAEPEHTQENKFIYMAVELQIVPVNYEWVLNCLGGYSLSSIHELLLCPAALLPASTAEWPSHLLDVE